MNNRSHPRRQLRKSLRTARRSLTPGFQHYAAQRICEFLATDPIFRRSRHIGFYMANDGEINPGKIAKMAAGRGKHCYLPLISDAIRPWERTRLLFQTYRPLIGNLEKNHYGILEPRYQPRLIINLAMLDLVIVPLVAFDSHLNRLGMGKGYYDRSFGRSLRWRRPLLLGLAYTSQRVQQLDSNKLDVPLDGVLTEQGISWKDELLGR